MTDFLLVDANSIMYAAAHGSQKLHAGDQETTSIFGFLKTLRKCMVAFPGAVPLILWDHKINWRKKVDKEYKARRGATKKSAAVRDSVRSQYGLIKVALQRLGLRQFEAEGWEADDLGGYLSEKLNAASKHVTLITGDKDWLQLVGPLCDWYEHRTEEHITEFTFQNKTGFETQSQFLQAKAIEGDSSDDLPGVGGLEPAATIAIMDQFGGIGQLREQWAEFMPTIKTGTALSRPKNKITKFLQDPEKMKRFAHNLRLMKLIGVKVDNLEEVKGEYDEAKFRSLLGRLSFQSILIKYPVWISAFHGEA